MTRRERLDANNVTGGLWALAAGIALLLALWCFGGFA